ncbi:conserved protein of unknown function [Xenorhabdus poinarii G6]|uniref:Uncharacterized protein n=1 Tax=Xenorhabdus poinarii G6 TaxID=1354304 RepID=A0A068R0X6_9GAMM|nr:hypothetical protein [Xenorhabdus poinarii]CDG20576.1 conserved protein of unknown function [Xenorhabdus poinarii G6]
MAQRTEIATHNITIGIKYDTETLNRLESQLEHIAELMERIQGSVQPTEINNDNPIRQIVRDELRQFVARESGRGGLFSTW